MNYVYAKLSKYDLRVVRIGGAGLGNILFPYARAVVFAKKNNCQVIWPTWFSIKIGPLIRNEIDKRFYNDLFENNSNYIDGLKKVQYLLTKQILKEDSKKNIDKLNEKIIEFTGFDTWFEEIKYDSKLVYDDLVSNLQNHNKRCLYFDFSNSISVHVRLGDFGKVSEKEIKEGRNNSRLPINWYVDMINQIRKILGNNIKVYIFSDGTDEELKDILDLENVERITFGSSIADIIALSRSKLFIASGSTFSAWARYLGRMSTITYTNQLKRCILTELDDTFEVEVDKIIPNDLHEQIRKIYK